MDALAGRCGLRSVVVSLVLLSAGCGSASVDDRAALGQPAPPLGSHASLNTPDHAPISLADLRGRPIAVLFWTPACEASVAALPRYLDLPRRSGVGDVVAILHTDQESARRLDEALRQHHVRLPVSIGSDLGAAYGATSTPYMALIDREGNLAWRGPFAEFADDAAGDLLRP